MTRLSDTLDAEAAYFEEYQERVLQWYERAAGLILGRKPWSWASLPGLPRMFTVYGPFYVRDEPKLVTNARGRTAWEYPDPWLSTELRHERRK